MEGGQHGNPRDDHGTPGPRPAEPGADARARHRDPAVPRRRGLQDGRPPRAEPRRRRDDARHPPGLRLAEGPHRLRHRPPVLRAQAAHGTAGLLPAPRVGRPRRLPAARGVGARHRRELARVELAELGGRHLARVRDHRPDRPARGRGRGRRCPHGRHDVGGAQQHLRRQHAEAHHRRQRQRPLLRADHRRHGALPQHRAHAPHLPGPLRDEPARVRRLRCAGRQPLPRPPRRAARVPHARHRQRGAVLQPRHQVPRAHRRARPAGDGGGARAGPRLRCARHRARDHGEGPRLRARAPGRRRPVPRRRADRPGDGGADRPVAGRQLDERLRGRDPGPRRRGPAHRRHHRGDAASGGPAQVRREAPGSRARRGHRRAARRDERRGPRLRRPPPGRRPLRDLRQPRLRPGAHGRRAAPCRREIRARSRGRHRSRRAEPSRHVGPGAAADRAPHPPQRPARRHAPPRGAGRGGQGR